MLRYFHFAARLLLALRVSRSQRCFVGRCISARHSVRQACFAAAVRGSGARISVQGHVCLVVVAPARLCSRAGVARVLLLARLFALRPVAA